MKPSTHDRKREQSRRAWEAEVVSRLQVAAGNRNFRVIADLTECHPETVRRYLRKGKPSAYFIARMCRAFTVSSEWVLWGTGTMGGPPLDRTAVESKPRKRDEVAAAGPPRAASAMTPLPG
jgi:hypothetical protein